MSITLRTWKESDLEDLVHNANDPEVANNLTDAFPSPYTLEDGKRKGVPRRLNSTIPTVLAKLWMDGVDGSKAVFRHQLIF